MRPLHTSHLFGIISDRMAMKSENSRNNEPLILMPSSFTATAAQTVAGTAVFVDPSDGQEYRLAICPADVGVQFVRMLDDGKLEVIAPTVHGRPDAQTYRPPRRPSATDPAARIKPSGKLAKNVVDIFEYAEKAAS